MSTYERDDPLADEPLRAASRKSTRRRRARCTPSPRAPARALALALAGTLALMLVCFGAFSGAALAHGTSVPNATSYIAKIKDVPAGLEAKVVDGDLRMWLRVPPSEKVEVLDYLGAPFLRFTRAGVAINLDSEMYYLDHIPLEYPPEKLTAHTPPNWQMVSEAHEYTWVDERLHALSTIALPPGTAYVGKWSIAVLVNGRRSKLGGGVWHSGAPSIVWFWPIVVLLACVLAIWRLRRRELDQRVARALAFCALASVGVAAVGKQLHGRPTVDAGQVVLLAIVLAVILPALWHVLRKPPGYFFYFLVSMSSIVGDFELIPTLVHGYVLLAVPALLARVAAVLCAGCGVGLLLFTFRMAEEPEELPVRAAHATS